GELFEGRLGGEKALLLKPMTYMNRSGLSVGEATRFYKLQPEQIFVFHDELDLAAGKVRAKTGGGHAGHNGIRDIATVIGPNFHRIRLGIGHPGEKGRVTGHVLSDFSKADEDWLGPVIEAVSEAAGWLAAGDLPRFMTEVARRTNESDQSATAGAADNGASKA
ncbi:MAG: aminoacyl-tRNA hydrolase, partial [Sphingomonadales bacterium]